MATRMAARYGSRRLFSSGSGKILSEEEKAVENAYFKKAEQEKLEKLARKGPQPDAGSGGSVTDAKPIVQMPRDHHLAFALHQQGEMVMKRSEI
ncbi:putative protein, mitochondrial, partial [Mucuna pruriens]